MWVHGDPGGYTLGLWSYRLGYLDLPLHSDTEVSSCKIPTSSRYPTQFHKGDQALCTSDAGTEGRLTKGKVYEVAMSVAMKNGFETLWLVFDNLGGQHLSFMATRFEKAGPK